MTIQLSYQDTSAVRAQYRKQLDAVKEQAEAFAFLQMAAMRKNIEMRNEMEALVRVIKDLPTEYQQSPSAEYAVQVAERRLKTFETTEFLDGAA